ncbi:hypothetical protein OG562_14735 [Streptomyces sp. NBC_01275]|uniref:hypothetical protein n=1 Tax=Streptomyces sp. NBC_01275 TaxID=2903807 RepID=UPI002256D181|nr:hypothetical protein [Streptomyces sp. NBC_01275]MCX4762208.1 hypothetical protein [Streptomyces sp. NBC_01275]
MRKLAIGVGVTGALALGVLVAPAASAASPALTFSGVTVNKGKAIVVGTTAKVKVPVTYTVTRPSDLTIDYKTNFAGVLLYRGTLKDQDNSLEPSAAPTCATTATTDTTVTQSCTQTLVVDPWDNLYEAADAGTWKAAGFYTRIDQDDDDSDGHISFELGYDLWANSATAKVQRAAHLTVNATPEPAVAGKTLTVKGSLTRANWDIGKYSGYKGQKVTLQFRAKGTSSYKNVKGITSAAGGALSTTTKATKSGYYRFVFAGTSTTAAKTTAGDYVQVDPPAYTG